MNVYKKKRLKPSYHTVFINNFKTSNQFKFLIFNLTILCQIDWELTYFIFILFYVFSPYFCLLFIFRKKFHSPDLCKERNSFHHKSQSIARCIWQWLWWILNRNRNHHLYSEFDLTSNYVINIGVVYTPANIEM